MPSIMLELPIHASGYYGAKDLESGKAPIHPQFCGFMVHVSILTSVHAGDQSMVTYMQPLQMNFN